MCFYDLCNYVLNQRFIPQIYKVSPQNIPVSMILVFCCRDGLKGRHQIQCIANDCNYTAGALQQGSPQGVAAIKARKGSNFKLQLRLTGFSIQNVDFTHTM